MDKIEINKLPSITWNWLKMNSTEVELPHSFKKLSQDDKAISQKISSSSSINLSLNDGENIAQNYEIDAKSGEVLDVVILTSSEKNASAFQVLNTKIKAQKDSKVHLTKIQLLGKNCTQIDNTSFLAEENANVEVNHIILGSKNTYFEVQGNLQGEKSTFESDASYLLKAENLLDMNYVINHFGKKTSCKMNVRGTLLDKAKKTYRGTIDFKNGCAGAIGDEQEEVLILSENAVNKSIPVILCDEEDVQGEHGASIGRLSEEVLFYMQTRGISKQKAEHLMALAKIKRVCSKISDKNAVQKIYDFIGEENE